MGSAGTRLIIDDDLGIRETLAPALSPTSQGRPTGGAAAASEALCTHPFDLILRNYRLSLPPSGPTGPSGHQAFLPAYPGYAHPGDTPALGASGFPAAQSGIHTFARRAVPGNAVPRE